ncbi:aldo/keto reductase [Pseudonocardia kunmingensis]|uniref:D-threo-aldose 1-dehydrogenase n=1 Tax=Pseudonocardia kunmingensis TaxID=630975 RepID=A0A543DVH1_9PSEU|nr:aldo/keto reductase [Pseudonocardia kunmingensis]TQM13316.1 D-threo-aldose 1-dehydrogenase [Pseudonocardia kunmingensis]
MQTQPLGKTGLSVTPLCHGTSPLGNFPSQYGYEVSADQAVATVRRVFEGPINFLDTSNNYGDGQAEVRIGRAIREAGGLPEGFVVATKVDPLPGSDDFSGERVRASVRESLERLGLDRLQLVYLHDPERITFAEATGPGGAVEALVALRDEGVIEHIGVAGGPIDLMIDYLALDVFEAVISHNRYTLVDSSAEPLIEDAAARGVAFVNAAPYGGGMLVRGPDAVPQYCYRPASAETIERVRAMERACRAHDVPLAAAALQFSTRDSRVASTIVGMSEPGRVEKTLQLAGWSIPDTLWEELLALAAPGRAGVGL